MECCAVHCTVQISEGTGRRAKLLLRLPLLLQFLRTQKWPSMSQWMLPSAHACMAGGSLVQSFERSAAATKDKSPQCSAPHRQIYPTSCQPAALAATGKPGFCSVELVQFLGCQYCLLGLLAHTDGGQRVARIDSICSRHLLLVCQWEHFNQSPCYYGVFAHMREKFCTFTIQRTRVQQKHSALTRWKTSL